MHGPGGGARANARHVTFAAGRQPPPVLDSLQARNGALSMSDAVNLEGLKVLVVEDEMMVSMLIEDMLGDLGCEVIGPASRLEEAIALANETELDCAVLDVNLGGQPIFPLADLLREKGAPFAFAT